MSDDYPIVNLSGLWRIEGGCDYTGWDVSWATWELLHG